MLYYVKLIGEQYELGRVGVRFSTGIASAVTNLIASSDATAIAGSLVTVIYISKD